MAGMKTCAASVAATTVGSTASGGLICYWGSNPQDRKTAESKVVIQVHHGFVGTYIYGKWNVPVAGTAAVPTFSDPVAATDWDFVLVAGQALESWDELGVVNVLLLAADGVAYTAGTDFSVRGW